MFLSIFLFNFFMCILQLYQVHSQQHCTMMLVLGHCLNSRHCIDERTILWSLSRWCWESLFCWKMQNFPSKQDKRIFKLFRASVRRADPAILATFSPKFMPHKKSLDQAGWGQGQLWEFCDIVWIFLCGLYSCIFTATKFTTHTYFVCSAWSSLRSYGVLY